MERIINQFDGECIYSAPDPTKKYRYDKVGKSDGFTKLMKWVLLTKKHPFLEEKIKNYLKKNKDQLEVKNNRGYTALMMAALVTKHVSTENTVRILINAGANLNTNKYSALWLAATYSNSYSTENTVKILIDAGSNVDLQSVNKSFSLIRAARNSVGFSTENTVKMLIDAGANLDLQDSSGSTAIMSAVLLSSRCSSENTVKMLIDAGANLDLKNNQGHTAIMIACKFSNSSSTMNTVKMLIDAGASLNLQDNQGDTAIMQMIQWGLGSNNSIINMLLDLGDERVDLTIKNKQGNTVKDLLKKKIPDEVLELYNRMFPKEE